MRKEKTRVASLSSLTPSSSPSHPLTVFSPVTPGYNSSPVPFKSLRLYLAFHLTLQSEQQWGPKVSGRQAVNTAPCRPPWTQITAYHTCTETSSPLFYRRFYLISFRRYFWSHWYEKCTTEIKTDLNEFMVLNWVTFKRILEEIREQQKSENTSLTMLHKRRKNRKFSFNGA